MSSQYLRSVDSETTLPKPAFSRNGKVIDNKIANIRNLVSNLDGAIQELESHDLPQLDDQFDFYHEVERFQINLIKSALRVSRGSQVKAAKLLKLKATTLNAKMKLFKLVTK